MARITLIDAQSSGISGDMLLAALIDTGADVERIRSVLSLIPKYYSKCKSIRLETREVKKHGFRALSVDLAISESGDEASAEELLHATAEIAQASDLSPKAKELSNASMALLIDVESQLHGVEITRAHLHEAGSADTLADVFGVAAACDSLGILEGEIFSTSVAVGGGLISFSHGTLGSPAPAVLEIVRRNGIPILGGPESEELATPTGLAILASLTKRFLEMYPPMTPDKVGYGAGKKELLKTPNMLRVVLGHSVGQRLGSETIQVVETNIDDVPGEMLGHALERVLDSGAKDAWITSAVFKKSRPGHVLHAICDAAHVLKVAEVLINETGTLGVRFHEWSRFVVPRELKTFNVQIEGRAFDVKVKLTRDGNGRVLNMKPEFDDIRQISEKLALPARTVSNMVAREVAQKVAAEEDHD